LSLSKQRIEGPLVADASIRVFDFAQPLLSMNGFACCHHALGADVLLGREIDTCHVTVRM
jgi:hypothetical protein